MKSARLELLLPDYEKIFRILHGISAYANKSKPPSCQFYNVVGALILKSLYRIDARPMMGAAFLRLEKLSGNTIAFANTNFDECNSHEKAFHCWVETPQSFIDFTSPVYSDYPNSFAAPRFMFQKPRSLMKSSHLELDVAGDFHFSPNISLTMDRLRSGIQSTKFQDFAEIAIEWAKLSKKSLLKQMPIKTDDGEVIKLNASPITLTGAW